MLLSFNLKKICFFGILTILSISTAYSQYSITGYSSVFQGVYYAPYTISGGPLSTSDHWTVTGGTINNTSNTTINNNGTPSIGITWNSGVTTGTVSYYVTGNSTPVVTYTVCVINNMADASN